MKSHLRGNTVIKSLLCFFDIILAFKIYILPFPWQQKIKQLNFCFVFVLFDHCVFSHFLLIEYKWRGNVLFQ